MIINNHDNTNDTYNAVVFWGKSLGKLVNFIIEQSLTIVLERKNVVNRKN